jgi:hypothetical protein
MYTKFFSTVFLILIIIGCEETSNLLDPPFETTSDRLNKCLTGVDYELIPLPEKSALWEDSIFTVSQEIDGSVGGRIILDKYYIDEEGDSVLMKADLRIPAGAFKDKKTITLTVDKKYAQVHFYPSMVFIDTLKLCQSFEGVDLENYQTGTIDFVYIKDDGSIELVKKNGVQIIVPIGIVRVLNAKLLHFSRYGWVRKTNSPDQMFQN